MVNESQVDEKQEQPQPELVPKESLDVISSKYRKAKKELDDMREAEKARSAEEEKNKLQEEGKIQELLDQKEKEFSDFKKSVVNEKKMNALQIEAIKMGVVDDELLTKLVDLDTIDIDDGRVAKDSIIEILNNLKEAKPYLFQEAKKTIGSNQGSPAQSEMPNLDRLFNREDYLKHEAEILKQNGITFK